MSQTKEKEQNYSSPVAEIFSVNTPSVLTENSLSEGQVEANVDNYEDGTLTF